MKKSYILKKSVKTKIQELVSCAIILGVIILMFMLCFKITNSQKEALNKCVSSGESRAFCERGIFGY